MNKTCYLVNHFSYNYSFHLNFCKTNGGKLLELADIDENSFIEDLYKNYLFEKPIWVRIDFRFFLNKLKLNIE